MTHPLGLVPVTVPLAAVKEKCKTSPGVSNFLPDDLDNIIERGTVAPHVNRILVHAGNTPGELLDTAGSMRSNAELEFVISDADMDSLRNLHERDYGPSSAFPVYSGK